MNRPAAEKGIAAAAAALVGTVLWYACGSSSGSRPSATDKAVEQRVRRAVVENVRGDVVAARASMHVAAAPTPEGDGSIASRGIII